MTHHAHINQTVALPCIALIAMGHGSSPLSTISVQRHTPISTCCLSTTVQANNLDIHLLPICIAWLQFSITYGTYCVLSEGKNVRFPAGCIGIGRRAANHRFTGGPGAAGARMDGRPGRAGQGLAAPASLLA
jgi:hypothetical protein